MPSFSFDQEREFNYASTSRNVVKIPANHPANNPNRPEFMTAGSTARALFRHAYRSLTAEDNATRATYWTALKDLSHTASRDPARQLIASRRQAQDVAIALAATSDLLSEPQLAGGVKAITARRELFETAPDHLTRQERLGLVRHFTARAIGEAAGIRPKEHAIPTGRLGEAITLMQKSAAFADLRDAARLVYEGTEPAPHDEFVVDPDNLEADAIDAFATQSRDTRLKRTHDVVLSFADSHLLEALGDQDRPATAADKAVFVMETAQEALVMEQLVKWAAAHDKLPSRDEAKDGLAAIHAALSQPHVASVQAIQYLTAEEVERLEPAKRRRVVHDRSKTDDAKRPFALVDRHEILQRAPIFGERSSRFAFMSAVLIDGATFYKNDIAVAQKINDVAESRADTPIKGSIIIGEDPSSNVFRAAIDAAKARGMPVVHLEVHDRRNSIRDVADNTTTVLRELDYQVTGERTGGRPVPLFSREGYSAVNGALVAVSGVARSDSQGQLVRWDALADIAERAYIFGYGKNYWNANQLIRKCAEHGKLRAVIDDSGTSIDLKVAYEAAKPTARNKLETARARLDAGDKSTARIDKEAPLSSLYARMLVNEMHTGRPKHKLDALSQISGTVGDLFTVSRAAATAGAGADLSPGERRKMQAIAAAVGASTFAIDTLPQIERIAAASNRAVEQITDARRSGFQIVFDGPGTRHGPLVAGGSAALETTSPSVLIVGSPREPNTALASAIDETVAAAAACGYRIVTVAEPGTNRSVIDAALRHKADIAVIAPDNPALKPPKDDRLCDSLSDVLLAGNGVIAAPLSTDVSESGSEARLRRAHELACEFADAAVLAKASTRELAAYTAARAGQSMPVAVIASTELDDTANRHLARPFSALSTPAGRSGTSVSSSFYSEMNNEGQWVTHREREPLVLGGHALERTIDWHNPARVVPLDRSSEAAKSFFLDVAREQASPMRDPTIRTERDLLIRMGLDHAPIDGSLLPENRPVVSDDDRLEDKLRRLLGSDPKRSRSRTGRETEALEL